jgi:alanine racemase
MQLGIRRAVVMTAPNRYCSSVMGLRLSVQRRAWRASVDAAAAARPGLVPVVKGNGYGLGRPSLMTIAAELAKTGPRVIGVGTVYEAHDVPTTRTAHVLTPHMDRLPANLPTATILTVGSVAHVAALRSHGWTGPVSLKLASSMHRYGATPAEFPGVVEAIAAAGWPLASYTIHLPLVGSNGGRRAEIDAWLPKLDPSIPLSVSHLDPEAYAALRTANPKRTFHIRSGTALWHGGKALMHLSADVLDVHAVSAGQVAGYRATTVPSEGHLVLVSAGSTHGTRPLEDGRSPFHYCRRRVALFERMHMHTSMLFVPVGDPLPAVGDRLDVQQPLITTSVDELVWLDD